MRRSHGSCGFRSRRTAASVGRIGVGLFGRPMRVLTNLVLLHLPQRTSHPVCQRPVAFRMVSLSSVLKGFPISLPTSRVVPNAQRVPRRRLRDTRHHDTGDSPIAVRERVDVEEPDEESRCPLGEPSDPALASRPFIHEHPLTEARERALEFIRGKASPLVPAMPEVHILRTVPSGMKRKRSSEHTFVRLADGVDPFRRRHSQDVSLPQQLLRRAVPSMDRLRSRFVLDQPKAGHELRQPWIDEPAQGHPLRAPLLETSDAMSMKSAQLAAYGRSAEWAAHDEPRPVSGGLT